MNTCILEIQHFLSDLGFKLSVTLVINFLSLSVETFGVVLHIVHVFKGAFHEIRNDVESVGHVLSSLTVGTNPALAVITEEVKLATVQAAKDRNVLLSGLTLRHLTTYNLTGSKILRELWLHYIQVCHLLVDVHHRNINVLRVAKHSWILNSSFGSSP